MKRIFVNYQRPGTLDYFLIGLVFLAVIIFCFLNPAFSFPDTNTYLKAHIYRFPGYIYFLRGLRYIFSENYEWAVVAFQLFFGLSAVFVTHRKLSKLFHLGFVLKLLFLGVLVFPFFNPLLVANKLVSEGLAYPLYLLLITYSLELLFTSKTKSIISVVGYFILLVLTRGQFIVAAPILLFMVLLKYRKSIFQLKNMAIFLIILFLPITTNLLDRLHRSAVYGYFETTPFSYVNAITLPLFVSKKDNANVLETETQKEIFRLTHRRMDSMGLLSSEAGETVRDQYLLFHNNFPQICNQNFHEQGREFLYTLNKTPYWSSIQIEKESKEMFPKLMDANFSNWLSIYVYGIKHGFKTWWILAFVIGVFIFSFIQSVRRSDETFEFLFFASSLLLSNAMV
ncbi:MAG: hypothetical protein HKN48_00415, partial [Flavobacteriaceae bacterium]|nr:hypothetical protein [Flavobacteriaceae bacterium]